MSRQIIKQPNGLYCIFSSIVDNVTMYDCTEEAIIEEWVAEQRVEITERVKGQIKKLEAGEKPYHQFTQSYEEMLLNIKEVHGKKAFTEIKSLIENGTK